MNSKTNTAGSLWWLVDHLENVAGLVAASGHRRAFDALLKAILVVEEELTEACLFSSDDERGDENTGVSEETWNSLENVVQINFRNKH